MKNICISILNKFSKKEHIEFEKFVQQGIFTTDKKIAMLYSGLKKHVIGRNFYSNQLEVRIYNSVFKQKLKAEKLSIPQKKQLNSVMNALRRLTEDFLVFKVMQEKPQIKQEALYEVLLEKKEYGLLEKHIKKDRKKINAIKGKNEIHYRFLYRIERYYSQLLNKKEMLYKQDSLNLINQNLDISYILEKLSLWTSMYSVEQVTQRKFDHSNFKLVETFIEDSVYRNNTTIVIYKAMIKLMKEKTEASYNQLLEILDENNSLVNEEVLKFGYGVAANFCVFNNRRGIFSHHHLLKIYQALDDKDLLLDNGAMPITKMKNLVAVGSQTRQFKWARIILNKYIYYVEKSAQKSVFEFCKGLINFSRNRYDAALQNFMRVDDVHFMFDLSYRLMIMKAHYEVDIEYDERTIQIFRSAEKFFTANKLLSTSNKTGYKNFVRMTINLYRIKHKATKMKISSFQAKLNAQQFNQDKIWLLAKLKEL